MSDGDQSVPFISREEIERRAKDVLRKHGLVSIPIDPVVLAKRLGIALHNAKFADDNLVGMIARNGDNTTLLVNATDPPFRKRFTIAHELGHHFLHLVGDGEFVDEEQNLFRGASGYEKPGISAQQRREIQANMFAAALLMPEDEVRAEYRRIMSLRQMARRFNVSEEAMGIRLSQLGMFDAEKEG